MPRFKVDNESISFWLRVKPRAAPERLTQDAAGELRLDLNAPAVEGQANAACVRFLARALRLPQSSVQIVSGHKARRKLLRVTGGSAEANMRRIDALAATGDGRKP
jgi:uncharacterized protein